jgi:cyclopropane fatty-acyl-phospholipid synthase-like methyltransferase
MKRSVSSCPLCRSDKISEYSSDKFRSYQLCHACQLIFVPRSQLISQVEEKKRYDTHNNSEADSRYRAYLAQIVDLVVTEVKIGSRGLDFGCGSSTLMAEIFKERGFSVDSYDLFYHPQEFIWEKTYDFIILSEVIEHLREPLATMQALKSRLNPGGSFFIKTALSPDSKESFDKWFYKRDSTHIQFFQLPSLESLMEQMQMSSLKILAKDLFHLHH